MIAISCSYVEKFLIKHLVLLDKRNTESHFITTIDLIRNLSLSEV